MKFIFPFFLLTFGCQQLLLLVVKCLKRQQRASALRFSEPAGGGVHPPGCWRKWSAVPVGCAPSRSAAPPSQLHARCRALACQPRDCRTSWTRHPRGDSQNWWGKKTAQLCFRIRKWRNFACEHPSKRGGCAFATSACLLLVGGLTATGVWVVSAGLLHNEAAAKALEAHVLEMGVLGALQELHGLSFPRRRLAGSQHLLQLAAVGRVRRAPGHAHLHKRVRA